MFCPSDVAGAVRVTGYSVLPGIFSGPRIAYANDAALEALSSDDCLRSPSRTFLYGIHLMPSLAFLAYHRAIVEALADFYMGEFEVYHSHLIATPPHQSRAGEPLGYHEDTTGGADRAGPPEIRVGVYLTTQEGAGGGNTLVIPASHRGGGSPSSGAPILAPAGSAIIYDRRLRHSGSRNGSSTQRLAAFFSFRHKS